MKRKKVRHKNVKFLKKNIGKFFHFFQNISKTTRARGGWRTFKKKFFKCFMLWYDCLWQAMMISTQKSVSPKQFWACISWSGRQSLHGLQPFQGLIDHDMHAFEGLHEENVGAIEMHAIHGLKSPCACISWFANLHFRVFFQI